MSAPIMHEPTDEPELPVIPISASLYNRLAATVHARFEVDGDRTVLLYNGQAYVAVGK